MQDGTLITEQRGTDMAWQDTVTPFVHRLINDYQRTGKWVECYHIAPSISESVDGLLGVHDVFLFDLADDSQMWAILYIGDDGYSADQFFSEKGARADWARIERRIRDDAAARMHAVSNK